MKHWTNDEGRHATARSNPRRHVAQRWKAATGEAQYPFCANLVCTLFLGSTETRKWSKWSNGQPCMPHWAACFRHRGNLKQFHMYITICRNVRIQRDLKTINPDPWQLLPTKVGPSGGKNFQGWCPKNFSAVQPFSAHKGSNAKPA